MIPAWRIGADTPTPVSPALPTATGLGMRTVVGVEMTGEMRGCGCFSRFWCPLVTGRALVDKTKATCVRAQQSESLAVIHTRAPPSSESSNGT